MKQRNQGKLKKGELLLEIGAEEIPSSYLEEGVSFLVNSFSSDMAVFPEAKGDLITVKGYQTPCRFVLHVQGLPSYFQKEEEIPGPQKGICYQDGKPTRALEGFLKRHKASFNDLKEISGRVVIHRTKKIHVEKLLKERLPVLIAGVTFPKMMGWDETNLRFPRPIRWLLCLYNGKVLSFSLGRLNAGGKTYGLGPARKEKKIKGPSDYFSFLRKEGILLEAVGPPGEGERKRFLRKKVEKALSHLGGDPGKIHPDLLNEVANLVEKPFVFSGQLDRASLNLPKEILIASMAKYQRVFSVENRSGKLLPYFIACANGPVTALSRVRKNYEHVLKARLDDAAFFYKEDMQKPFSQRREALKGLIYHQKLGSMYEKSERMKELSFAFSQSTGFHEKDLSRACALAKNDLVTEMVKEFPSLQGVVGYYYAKEQGEKDTVSLAIREQYLPKGSDAEPPESPLGAAVSFLDKLDHLVGCFHAGEFPTGSTDPYGLRRAANALFRILLHQKWTIPLEALIEKNFDLFSSGREARKRLADFLQERLKGIFRERGVQEDLLDGVVRDLRDPAKTTEILFCLKEMMEKQKETFFAAFKVVERTHNILKPVQPKERQSLGEVQPNLFQDEIEKNLWNIYNTNKDTIARLIDENAWSKATAKYGKAFFDILHQFFDKVLVNVEDETIRRNRLAMMKRINELYTGPVADLSKLTMNRDGF